MNGVEWVREASLTAAGKFFCADSIFEGSCDGRLEEADGPVETGRPVDTDRLVKAGHFAEAGRPAKGGLLATSSSVIAESEGSRPVAGCPEAKGRAEARWTLEASGAADADGTGAGGSSGSGTSADAGEPPIALKAPWTGELPKSHEPGSMGASSQADGPGDTVLAPKPSERFETARLPRSLAEQTVAFAHRPGPHGSLIDRSGDRTTSGEEMSGASKAGSLWPMMHILLGLNAETWERAARKAGLAGALPQRELIAGGHVSEAEFVRAAARLMGVRFLADVRAEGLIITGEQSHQVLGRREGLPAVTAVDSTGRCVLLIAPSELDLDELGAFLDRQRDMLKGVIFVCADCLRRAIGRRGSREMLRRAIAGLKETLPQLSAHLVLTGRQGVVVGFLLAGLVQCLVLWPMEVALAAYILAFACCVLCTLMRVVALTEVLWPRQPELPAEVEMPEEGVPVYSVLVALYREAEVVPQLLTALGRLVWPRSRLEIKLVCEEDDHETLAAIRSIELRDYVQVVEVPSSTPRTKPKALRYALQHCRGDFVVIYDAEDRPHPYQLVEAWRRFRRSDQILACLQAPLVITNGWGSWLSRMFAFEYSALFAAMLPWLGSHRLVLPLGGTSNHFRRHALEASGAWDPYNVTEDADLGIRLARMGYHSDTILSPTYEDAPTRPDVWLRQRTRWFKGWLQTWLVHMRDPRALFRDIGAGSFLVVQGLVFCTLIAVMSNVFMVPTLLYGALRHSFVEGVTAYERILFALNVANLLFGYAGFLTIGWYSLPPRKREGLWRYALYTPGYWFMLSLAAWRAAWQLYRKPFYWEKTPHRRKQIQPDTKRQGAEG